MITVSRITAVLFVLAIITALGGCRTGDEINHSYIGKVNETFKDLTITKGSDGKFYLNDKKGKKISTIELSGYFEHTRKIKRFLGNEDPAVMADLFKSDKLKGMSETIKRFNPVVLRRNSYFNENYILPLRRSMIPERWTEETKPVEFNKSLKYIYNMVRSQYDSYESFCGKYYQVHNTEQRELIDLIWKSWVQLPSEKRDNFLSEDKVETNKAAPGSCGNIDPESNWTLRGNLELRDFVRDAIDKTNDKKLYGESPESNNYLECQYGQYVKDIKETFRFASGYSNYKREMESYALSKKQDYLSKWDEARSTFAQEDAKLQSSLSQLSSINMRINRFQSEIKSLKERQKEWDDSISELILKRRYWVIGCGWQEHIEGRTGNQIIAKAKETATKEALYQFVEHFKTNTQDFYANYADVASENNETFKKKIGHFKTEIEERTVLRYLPTINKPIQHKDGYYWFGLFEVTSSRKSPHSREGNREKGSEGSITIDELKKWSKNNGARRATNVVDSSEISIIRHKCFKEDETEIIKIAEMDLSQMSLYLNQNNDYNKNIIARISDATNAIKNISQRVMRYKERITSLKTQKKKLQNSLASSLAAIMKNLHAMLKNEQSICRNVLFVYELSANQDHVMVQRSLDYILPQNQSIPQGREESLLQELWQAEQQLKQRTSSQETFVRYSSDGEKHYSRRPKQTQQNFKISQIRFVGFAELMIQNPNIKTIKTAFWARAKMVNGRKDEPLPPPPPSEPEVDGDEDDDWYLPPELEPEFEPEVDGDDDWFEEEPTTPQVFDRSMPNDAWDIFVGDEFMPYSEANATCPKGCIIPTRDYILGLEKPKKRNGSCALWEDYPYYTSTPEGDSRRLVVFWNEDKKIFEINGDELAADIEEGNAMPLCICP